eukprot:1158798-Pelagomonas_calceolata.AAC.6
MHVPGCELVELKRCQTTAAHPLLPPSSPLAHTGMQVLGCVLVELGKPGHLRPLEQLQTIQASSAYFCGCPCWVRGLGVPVLGTSQSTCGPFQLAAEPTELHNSNCDGILNLCSIDGVSCFVDRDVKAQKFADAMWSRTAPMN